MRVESTLIQQTVGIEDSKSSLKSEVKAWGRLFQHTYRARTMVGVLMMVFQRKDPFRARFRTYGVTLFDSGRMERNQRLVVLWADSCTEYWLARRYSDATGVGWHWHCAVPRRVACNRLYRSLG